MKKKRRVFPHTCKGFLKEGVHCSACGQWESFEDYFLCEQCGLMLCLKCGVKHMVHRSGRSFEVQEKIKADKKRRGIPEGVNH